MRENQFLFRIHRFHQVQIFGSYLQFFLHSDNGKLSALAATYNSLKRYAVSGVDTSDVLALLRLAINCRATCRERGWVRMGLANA
jgi:hypothetical protein